MAEGDEVLTHLWIGNGFTQQTALDTYEDKKPELITVDDEIGKVFHDGARGPDDRVAGGSSPRPRRTRSARAATPPSASATRTPW